jgi:hypothetical protein
VRRGCGARAHTGSIRTDRHGSYDAHDPFGVVAGVGRTRRWVRRPGVRATGWVVRGAPPHPVVTRRSDRSGELRAPMFSSSPRRARRPRGAVAALTSYARNATRVSWSACSRRDRRSPA